MDKNRERYILALDMANRLSDIFRRGTQLLNKTVVAELNKGTPASYKRLIARVIELETERDEARALVAKLQKAAGGVITHCDNCGGSWVDDGLNAGCTCVKIGELQRERDELEGCFNEANQHIVDYLKKIDDLQSIVAKLRKAAKDTVDDYEKSQRDGYGGEIASISVDELQSAVIASMLPKTADGVPVVPGMTVWVILDNRVFPLKIITHRSGFVAESGYLEHAPSTLKNSVRTDAADCYSTREAAGAAKELFE